MEVRSDRTPQPARGERAVSCFDRHALEIHAKGQLSRSSAPDSADQDTLRGATACPNRRCCSPIAHAPGGAAALARYRHRLDRTDIAPGAWYLHDNRMPAGMMIEAGQADLLLVSWLGVDALNRGERVYRLLGCELTYHGGLPGRRGDPALRDRRRRPRAAGGGPALLLPLHLYPRRIPRLTVRGGQAGFFTDEELAGSAGVLWDPATRVRGGARLDPPRSPPGRRGSPVRSSRPSRTAGPTSASAPASKRPRRTPAPRICRAAGCSCSKR